MSLYPKNQLPFNESLFAEPDSEYRGAPFWAWNHHLEEDTIRRQVRMFKEMGLGGYHAHVRTGLDTPYLSEEFMHMMGAALDEAKQQGLLHWLYDEDRWPSGPAGGIVTKNTEYAQKKLLFTAFPKKDAEVFRPGIVMEHGRFYELAKYSVQLDDGMLKDYRRVPDGEWTAYLYLDEPQEWWNDQGYADTLKKEAIEEFVRVTHEKYYEAFGEDFSGAIPAIFTDEPQFAKKQVLTLVEQPQEVSIPFTDDLDETYREAYGDSLLDHLPELFWELPDGKVSLVRYRYHDHVCERFAAAFADTVGDWCRVHHLLLTGHMMEEPTLQSQTAMLGEAMRSYRGFGLPGIDMLCDRREYTTAKQAQSASHQMGCPGVTSELYGVTNWDYDFRGHKLQGDWQQALGVTTRVHHLSWMSMEGEAKRDYPASIAYQSPWYKEYKYIEDHFARANTVLTRGTPVVRIGVIHPIESYWLYYGSNEKTGRIREEMEQHFLDLNRWLLLDQLDFDYISEALLKDLDQRGFTVEAEKGFPAGVMNYDVILVPALKTIRSSTLDRLEDFVSRGGNVIFLGSIPDHVDALPSERAIRLAEKCRTIDFSKPRILEALEPWREIEVTSLSGFKTEQTNLAPGMHASHYLYQYRAEEDVRWLFLAHAVKMEDPDQPRPERIGLKIRGRYRVSLMDTLTGQIRPLPAEYKNDDTVLEFVLYEHDSLLLKLVPGIGEAPAESRPAGRPEQAAQKLSLPARVPVELSEPNVLLLDLAEYRLDDGPWQEEEEILRIDKKLREWLHYPLRSSKSSQPYMMKEEEGPAHTVELKFSIHSAIRAENLSLALENRKETQVFLDEEKVDISERKGYYTDEAIETVAFPSFEAGEHTLRMVLPFRKKTNLEWSYLLGDFGVRVQGRQCFLTEPVRELAFGDWVPQGLPFYGGNVTYNVPVKPWGEGGLLVEATQYRSPLLTISYVDEQGYSTRPEPLVFSPYRAGLADAGNIRTIRITAFGSRINTFGQVHNCNETMTWFGADSWRTEGSAWSYEYHLHRMGVLKSPEISMF